MDKQRGKRPVVLIILLMVLLGGGFLSYKMINREESKQKFRMVKVERGEISSTVTATGTINPVITVSVGSQVSGTIQALYADFNSPVRKGQVIAQIDPAIFQSQVDQAKADVSNAQANLMNAQANLEEAAANLNKAEVAVSDTKRTLNRDRPLTEEQAIAQSTLDTAQTDYDTAVAQQQSTKAQLESAKSQIDSSKAQMEESKAALKLAETNLGYTRISSPVDGIVISRNVDVGQTVAASLQSPTLFSIAKDLTQMQVDTNVSEADVGRITVGRDATFTVDAYPERTFRGKISDIRNAPTTIENVVTYDAVVQVDNRDLRLKPGMTANVSFLVAHKEGILKVPNLALRFRPEFAREKGNEGREKRPQAIGASSREDKRPGRVWILSSKGEPIPIPISPGITDGTFTDVAEGDLKEGMEVIVEDLSKKKEGGPSSNF